MRTLRVLFVCSGNKTQGISPIVSNQGEAIRKLGVEVEYFPIIGKGLWGYLKHYFRLKKNIRNGNYNAIHAHYSMCGILVSLTAPFNRNIIVSLMGSFYKGSVKYHLIHLFARLSWKTVIVKSERMKQQINLKNPVLIPNGVAIEKYNTDLDRNEIRKKLAFDPTKKYVVFVSDPNRPEKNFKLCENAVKALNNPDVYLLPVYNVLPDVVVEYQIAADVLMLTSFTEGSPNVIKEAMAAGCPLVTTNVGDVKNVVGHTPGCYILETFEINEAALMLQKALEFSGRTNGLQRIKELGLDNLTIGNRIISLYK